MFIYPFPHLEVILLHHYYQSQYLLTLAIVESYRFLGTTVPQYQQMIHFLHQFNLPQELPIQFSISVMQSVLDAVFLFCMSSNCSFLVE